MAPLKTQHTLMSLCVRTHTHTQHNTVNISAVCFLLCLKQSVMTQHDQLRGLYPIIQGTCVYVCVGDSKGALTGMNFEDEGVLLLDGLRQAAASIAFVLAVSVFRYDVGEVKVTVQTHRHSLILDNRSHRCRKTCGETQSLT